MWLDLNLTAFSYSPGQLCSSPRELALGALAALLNVGQLDRAKGLELATKQLAQSQVDPLTHAAWMFFSVRESNMEIEKHHS